jgi:hypothetical protein
MVVVLLFIGTHDNAGEEGQEEEKEEERRVGVESLESAHNRRLTCFCSCIACRG